MTADPERLLDDDGGDELTRELLESVRELHPPAAAKEHAWNGLAAQIAAATAAGAAASSAARTAAASSGGIAGKSAGAALAAKTALVIAAGGAVALAYVGVQHTYAPSDAHTHERARATAPVVSSSQPSAAAPAAQPEAEPAPALPVNERAGKRAAKKPRDSLAVESALLATARAQLRAGDPASAQATLGRLQAQFPHGVLGQEREVLAIELLSTRGDARGAARRARAFIATHPNSPHSAMLARFLDRP